MRIEEGKYYRTRDGRKVGPAKKYPYRGRFEFDGEHHFCHGPDGKYLGRDSSLDLIAEWIDEGPIRTETVRRLEPGVYGRLSVAEDTAPYVSIALTNPDGTEVGERYRRSFSSPELRELARVALEIAEYLEDVD